MLCNNTGGDRPLSIQLSVPPRLPSHDLAIEPVSGEPGLSCWKGTARVSETLGEAPSLLAMCTTDTSADQSTNLTVLAGESKSLLLVSARFSSIDTDVAPSFDLVSNAAAAVEQATSTGSAALWAAHTKAMQDRTAPGISIEGNVPLARAINASLYALMCSVRADVLYSSSPGGLATNACEFTSIFLLFLGAHGRVDGLCRQRAQLLGWYEAAIIVVYALYANRRKHLV